MAHFLVSIGLVAIGRSIGLISFGVDFVGFYACCANDCQQEVGDCLSMDFMRILKSLEELLFEVVTWLIFYPLTMWRSTVTPLRMMRYSETELGDRAEDQYDDTLSPPLTLLITLLIAQAISSAIPSIYDASTLPKILASTTNLLLVRGIAFSVIPLVMAHALVRHKSIRLTRETLRPPFYAQCFVVAPFVLLASISLDVIVMPHEAGLLWGSTMFAIAFTWYGQAQIRWFMLDLGAGVLAATWIFASRFIVSLIAVLVIMLAIGWSAKNWVP